MKLTGLISGALVFVVFAVYGFVPALVTLIAYGLTYYLLLVGSGVRKEITDDRKQRETVR